MSVSTLPVGRVGVVAIALLLTIPAASTGDAPPGTPQTPTPLFPSGVDLITVDAVVVDGKGHPVPGLQREDFVVTEDGRPQEIASFEASEDKDPSTPMSAEIDAPAAIATNRAPSSPGRAYAVLLDDVWLPMLDGPSVRQALTTFLERSLRPGDQVVLATTTGDLQWGARIPEGREDLLAVVARFKGRGPALGRGKEAFLDTVGSVSAGDRSVVLQLNAMSEYQANRIVEGGAPGNTAIAREIEARRRERMRRTHAALRREIEALSSVGGRKSLLLVTQGFIQDRGPELQETTRIAHAANVAIYFLDPRGLETTPGYSADNAAAPNPAATTTAILEQDVLETAGSQDLAADTGGFSVRNTNDLAPGLDRITTESRGFYLLGFHPPAGKPAGGWRTLRVAVKRSSLTVRARRGYRLPDSPDRARSMQATNPADAIPLRLASYVLEPVDAEKTRVTVAMEIDVSGLPAPEGGGASQLGLRLEAIPRDGGDTHSHDLTLGGSAPDGDSASRGGWQSVRPSFALPPGVYHIRAEVEDPATRRRGVVDQRVAVPGPSAFRISTPVLSDTLMPTTEGDSSVPAPVAHRSFSASGGRPLFYAFAVLGAARDAATGRSDVTFSLAVKDPAGRVILKPVDAALAPSADGRLEQTIGLPLEQMPAGEYALELTTHDRVAGRIVERRETFVVEGAPSPAATAGLKEPAAPGPDTPSVAPDLIPILERAGRYVVAYQEAFRDLVAEEIYHQQFFGGRRQEKRSSRAEMVFVSLPGPIPWAVFRDVYEVDGKKVRDREGRLERLFRNSPEEAAAAATKAKVILEESARFNLGPVRRTLNVPTFALVVLHPSNQHRFSFERAGSAPIDGTEALEIAFTEKHRPTLVGGADGDVAASGSVWVDADRGTVLRTEVSYRSDVKNLVRRTLTHIVTEYGRDPRLQVTVPLRMTETYEWGRGLGGILVDETGNLWNGPTIKATAIYSGYRRFEVTTDEEYDRPPEEPQ